MAQTNSLCLAVGAGAIGKSISGYVFTRLGCTVLFADVVDAVIEDLNRRSGYTLYTSRYDGTIEETCIDGVSAARIGDERTEQTALQADFLCTAVGPVGLRAFLPTLTGWLRKRNETGGRPQWLLLFENDADCKNVVTQAVETALGEVPEWLHIVKTSIERMTKPHLTAEGVFDVLAEPFIPVIVSEGALAGSPAEGRNDLFQCVGSLDAYYSRKLYTNNLGHALLGYMGTYYGYTDAPQAMADAHMEASLAEVLRESGAMLERVYGFPHEEMQAHLAALPARYRNPGLRDSLQRLARDPVRKLGREERILRAAELCLGCGIRPAAISSILFYALRYSNSDDPSATQVQEIYARGGLEAVLREICGLDGTDRLFAEIRGLSREFKY